MNKMIRAVLATAIWIAMSVAALACDICGCSISSNNPFLFPSASRHFVGLSYQYRSYRIQPSDEPHGRMNASIVVLNGQYALGNKFRLQASLPYISNHYTSGGSTNIRSGFGDLNLMLGYNLLRTSKHLLTFSAGVKLNTASSTPEVGGGTFDLQTGTGSTDYLLNGAYRYTQGKWIGLLQAAYRYNNQDKKSGLRFGDFSAVSMNIYRKVAFSKLTLTPYISGSIEHRMDDARSQVLVKHSGGNISLVGMGMDINTRKIALGFNCQTPVFQNLSGGVIHESVRINTHIFLTL
jgi:uncharacterized membrane protein